MSVIRIQEGGRVFVVDVCNDESDYTYRHNWHSYRGIDDVINILRHDLFCICEITCCDENPYTILLTIIGLNLQGAVCSEFFIVSKDAWIRYVYGWRFGHEVKWQECGF